MRQGGPQNASGAGASALKGSRQTTDNGQVACSTDRCDLAWVFWMAAFLAVPLEVAEFGRARITCFLQVYPCSREKARLLRVLFCHPLRCRAYRHDAIHRRHLGMVVAEELVSAGFAEARVRRPLPLVEVA
jgi:hypothetical protein